MPSPRARVKQTAKRYEVAREKRDTAIVEGRAAGMSLREIADACGIAVESVRRVIASREVA